MRDQEKEECSICDEIHLKKGRRDCIYLSQMEQNYHIDNRILYDDGDFVVMPSLGPLSDCHLLMFPKKHIYSYALLDTALLKKAEIYINKIVKYVEEKYGKCMVFEHGVLDNGMKGSASCNHAHMHIISCSAVLFDIFEKEGFQLRKIKTLEELKMQKVRGVPYFYYMDYTGNSYIMDDIVQQSQYIRLLIAEVLHRPEIGNWKKNWGLAGVNRMVRDMREDFSWILKNAM